MTKATVMAILLLLASHAATAHTQLSASVPEDQAVLEAAPDEITLHFSDAVHLIGLTIETTEGVTISDGPITRETSQSFTFATPSLDAGEYLVHWRAVGADTHIIAGVVRFSVTAAHSAGDSMHSHAH